MTTNTNTNTTQHQNTSHDREPSVRANVADELNQLRDDLWRVAEDVRMKAKGASAEVNDTRRALERELERFSGQVKEAAGDTQDDLKQMGRDLKMRFQKLANQLVMPAS